MSHAAVSSTRATNFPAKKHLSYLQHFDVSTPVLGWANPVLVSSRHCRLVPRAATTGIRIPFKGVHYTALMNMYMYVICIHAASSTMCWTQVFMLYISHVWEWYVLSKASALVPLFSVAWWTLCRSATRCLQTELVVQAKLRFHVRCLLTIIIFVIVDCILKSATHSFVQSTLSRMLVCAPSFYGTRKCHHLSYLIIPIFVCCAVSHYLFCSFLSHIDPTLICPFSLLSTVFFVTYSSLLSFCNLPPFVYSPHSSCSLLSIYIRGFHFLSGAPQHPKYTKEFTFA